MFSELEKNYRLQNFIDLGNQVTSNNGNTLIHYFQIFTFTIKNKLESENHLNLREKKN